MKAKTSVAVRYSARFKFKSADLVELVIIDSVDNSIFTILWQFRDKLPVVTSVSEQKDVTDSPSEETNHEDETPEIDETEEDDE